MAHKLHGSRFAEKRDFSHLEFQRVTRYVRHVTVSGYLWSSAAVFPVRLKD
jgi:hypothetical protein